MAGVGGGFHVSARRLRRGHRRLIYFHQRRGWRHSGGGLIQASNGLCYGTTLNGGTNSPGVASGTIFKVTTNGSFTPLYTLNQGAANGGDAYAGLVLATNGILYGDAYNGGTNGYGSVFKITTNGAFTELYGFTRLRGASLTNIDGANPIAALVRGTNGNYYGTAPAGGTNGSGAIFEITTNGSFTLLHYFTNVPDGADPGALLQSSNGLIYGATTNGGANGNGLIFKMTAAGALTPLYSFTNGVDGASPGPALVQGANGILFGTASGGGTNSPASSSKSPPTDFLRPCIPLRLAGVQGLLHHKRRWPQTRPIA